MSYRGHYVRGTIVRHDARPPMPLRSVGVSIQAAGSVSDFFRSFVGIRSVKMHAVYTQAATITVFIAVRCYILPAAPLVMFTQSNSSIFISTLHFPFLPILFAVDFIFFFRTDPTNYPDCLPILLSISVILLFLFSIFNFWVPRGRLSYVKTASRIVSYTR